MSRQPLVFHLEQDPVEISVAYSKAKWPPVCTSPPIASPA
jgi:hypothetical protein